MIELAKEAGLWIVTVNRPDKANSLTGAMLAELAEAAGEMRALILTGYGRILSFVWMRRHRRNGLPRLPGLWVDFGWMIFPSNRVRIVVATRPVDFRKGCLTSAPMGRLEDCIELAMEVPLKPLDSLQKR